MMPQSDFGICDRINHLMNEKCLTAAEFAKKTTIPYKTVNQYCNYINSPSTANLKKIAIHMNVSADWLLGLTDTQIIGQALASSRAETASDTDSFKSAMA